MTELPSGTVTFLFSDIEGSTRLWEEHPEAMRDALVRHDELLRAAIEGHGGYVVKTTGDGFHAAFSAADVGVSAAIASQRGLETATWGETGPLRVRMGLHTGVASLRDGDYFGSSLNRAARLMGVAHGGQVVCSQATTDLARDVLAEGVDFVDLGEHRLRDLSRAERVFQVCAPGLVGEFAALTSLDAFPGNLPLQVSSFIGRERELVRVTKALDVARVVTLTGVGGVGKTRLALQVAAEVLPRFREGAWLVELAPVRDPEGVVGTFASVFGVTARSGKSVEESLVEFLRTKQLLLVIDNCEHVLGAVADLVEVLEHSCAGLVVLATSREGLGVDGEQMLVVPSLAAPARDADLDATAAADAVQLFVERATAAKADFVLTDQNMGAVVQVCRRLDGVPLAIELAAARVPAMSPSVLATRLDQRFRVLTGGRRGAVERHQTLRAAIDWSYELCSEPEQRVLARLTVFSGGCTLEAVEAVCAGGSIDTDEVFELLANLVARSLVVADDTESGDVRYRLLETIRQYGEERLSEHDETDLLRAGHAEYFTEYAGIVTEQIRGPEQIDAGRRFDAEHENLLAAMNHAIDTDDADLAFRLLYNSSPAFSEVSYELRLPAEPILDLSGAAEHSLYPYGLVLAGLQAAARGDRRTAVMLREQALAAAERLGDPDRHVEVLSLGTLSILAYATGETHDAAVYGEHTAEVTRSCGRLAHLAGILAAAATYYAMAGEPEAAIPLATEGLAVARRVGMPTHIALNLTALAGAFADQDPERARRLLDESRQLRESLGYESWGEMTQAVLIGARLGDWHHTLTLAAPSIRHLHWNGDWPLLGAIYNVAARAVAATDAEAAAVLQGAAHRLVTAGIAPPASTEPDVAPPSSDASAPRSPSRTDYVTELRRATTGLLVNALGDARMHELRAQGDAMDTDDAVAYALEAIKRARASSSPVP